MSRNYDNWERLVAAVIKREEIWELCHQDSTSPSICSEASSSDFSSIFRIENEHESAQRPIPKLLSLEGFLKSTQWLGKGRFGDSDFSSIFRVENEQESAQRPIPKLLSLEGFLKSAQRLSKGRFGDSDFSSSVLLENNQESSQRPIPKLILLEGFWKSCGRLGKGRFGDSILIQLQRGVRVSDQEFLAEGTQLVMKKLRSKVTKVSEEEFKTVYGNCRHENVGAPMAYYFSTEGNYIFNDYHGQGSVYDLLYGQSSGLRNWETCLKIAIGAARGIAHIHRQCGGKLAHGNITSSNIFFNSERYGCVSDLVMAGTKIRPGKLVVRRHQYSSEYKFKHISQETDVYNFGVVLLELVSGSSPMERQAGFRRNVSVVKWAISVRPQHESSYQRSGGIPLCDELDMLEYERGFEVERQIADEMEDMFGVAIWCLATLPQDRPKMFEVVLNLENIMCNTPPSRFSTKLNCCLLTHY